MKEQRAKLVLAKDKIMSYKERIRRTSFRFGKFDNDKKRAMMMLETKVRFSIT